MKHITHNGEIVTSQKLKDALNSVANDWIELAYAIKNEDAYASHVTEETKQNILSQGLEQAERIRSGQESGFWVWQRINSKLTGECIALLPI